MANPSKLKRGFCIRADRDSFPPAWPTKLMLIAMLLMPLSQAFASSYGLKGTLTYQVHETDAAGNQKNRPPVEREFQIFVQDCNWKARMQFKDAKSTIEYVEYEFDGTNIFYTFKAVKGIYVKGPVPTTAPRLTDDLLPSVMVEPGPVPRTFTSAGGEYAWLAFASGCYFKNLTTNRVIDFPITDARQGEVSTPLRHEVDCRYVLSSKPPYLPTEVEFEAIDYSFLGQNEDTTPKTSSEFTLGARFQSEGFTNFGRLLLPTKFKYERYTPINHHQQSESRSILLTVHGSVSEFSHEEPAWHSKNVAEKAVIVDMRVPEPGVMYFATNRAIPSLTDTNLLALRKIAAETPKGDGKRQLGDPRNTKLR